MIRHEYRVLRRFYICRGKISFSGPTRGGNRKNGKTEFKEGKVYIDYTDGVELSRVTTKLLEGGIIKKEDSKKFVPKGRSKSDKPKKFMIDR